MSRRVGARRARTWYWRQAIAIATRVSAARLLPGTVHAPAVAAAGHRSRADARGGPGRVMRDTPGARCSRDPRSRWSSSSRWAWPSRPMPPSSTWPMRSTCRPFRFQGVDRAVVIASAPKSDPFADRSLGRASRLSRLDRTEHDAHLVCRRGLLGPEPLGRRSTRTAGGFRASPRPSSARSRRRRSSAGSSPTRRRSRAGIDEWSFRTRCGCDGSAGTRAWSARDRAPRRRGVRSGRRHAPGPRTPLRLPDLGPAGIHGSRSGWSAVAAGCW